MILLWGDKPNTIHFALCISIFCSVASNDSRNWQHIEVYLGEVIPKSVFLEKNYAVTLYCGSNDSPVRWKFRRYNLPWNSSAPGVSNKHVKGTNQLTLMKLQSEDSGLYFCIWRSGGRRFVSSASEVWISRSYNDVLSIGKVGPSWVEVSTNSTVTLTCHSVKPTEWFGCHLQHQSKSIQGNSLTLLNLKVEHSGEYICRGAFHNQWTNIIFHAKSRIIVDSTLIRINNFRPLHLRT